MLAFWRGLNDSYVREKLLHSWENRPRLLIQKGRKPSLEEQDRSFHEAFKTSKFCICPAGPDIDRYIALAIQYGCVPVILSDYYDLPFTDILDWRTFSLIVKESSVYYIKGLLEVVGEPEYQALQTNVVRVQIFLSHKPSTSIVSEILSGKDL
ncbi:unnamed protein product [Dovyalis caffra]|uniref:Exostosin GT47 domain-containing protein n=1 Tax=Dovyalis caffra TaxID=77055 RepID=A0AAV1SQM0_9ROSI|nr:unnamed protein product [Dovyalis caffra]